MPLANCRTLDLPPYFDCPRFDPNGLVPLVKQMDGELERPNQIPPILSALPPLAAKRKEWVGSWDVARLALHLLHHPGELDGVA